MDLRAYQQWVEEFDRARGWDLCPATDSLAHLVEELGEVTRCILVLHGYRPSTPAEREDWRNQLGEELADLVTFAVKLAYTYQLDLAGFLQENRIKCETRYGGLEQNSSQTQEYLQKLAKNSAEMLIEYRKRFGEKE